MLMRMRRLVGHYILCWFSLFLVSITLSHNPTAAASTAVASPSATKYGGGSGHIAYQSDLSSGADIFTVDMNGVEKRLVTADNLNSEAMPVWSPRGNRLSFSMRRALSDNPIGQIYVVNSDGTYLRRLTRDGGFSPSWSPEGTQIAFAANDGVYVINENGQNLHRVAHGPIFAGQSVRWSPDGKSIAFISSSTTTDQMEMYVLDISTSAIQVVTNNQASIYSFVWSPDSQSLAFSSNRDNHAKSDIYITSLSNHNQRRLTENDSYNRYPVWSPDGTTLAFVMSDEHSSDIYLMNVNGTNLQKLASGDLPAWSPDGASIALVPFQDNGLFNGISIIGRDGSHLRHLIQRTAGNEPAYLTWQP